MAQTDVSLVVVTVVDVRSAFEIAVIAFVDCDITMFSWNGEFSLKISAVAIKLMCCDASTLRINNCVLCSSKYIHIAFLDVV